MTKRPYKNTIYEVWKNDNVIALFTSRDKVATAIRFAKKNNADKVVAFHNPDENTDGFYEDVWASKNYSEEM